MPPTVSSTTTSTASSTATSTGSSTPPSTTSHIGSALPRDEIDSLIVEVSSLRADLLAAERTHASAIAETHPRHRRSAANLVHYVELRRHDIRDLQRRLSALGLSSLGRSEAHVLASVDAVLAVLTALVGDREPDERATEISIGEGDVLLARNADSLLGPQVASRLARIMVTLPSDAADDADLVDRFAEFGMDVARINCAHDDADAWAAMITHLRRSDAPVRVAIDLAGPKLRTVALREGPPVRKIRPRRDAYGQVVAPAEIRLVPAPLDDAPPDADDRTTPNADTATMTVDDRQWLGRRTPGELIELVDTRGSTRRWTVMDADGSSCSVAVSKTSYVTNGTELRCPTDPLTPSARVTGLAPTQHTDRVHRGDHINLVLTSEAPAEAVDLDDGPTIGCSLLELFTAARAGDPIWFDDGRIGGTIISVDSAARPTSMIVEVTDVAPTGAPLKAGKGINVPDTELVLSPLTPKDLDDLDHLAADVDIVSLSFVREPADVARLQQELRRRGAFDVGIVLKIENVRAFTNLPQLLLQAMTWERVGVMIARGDLAVEVGFERLAEVQEEIMWACEAAHVPVIWATQVLETLAKQGRPSRAEVTDAAMAVRAECVMLNKGPHVLAALTSLDSILARMGDHQRKKRSLLRRLTSWDLDAPAASVTDVGADEALLGHGVSDPVG